MFPTTQSVGDGEDALASTLAGWTPEQQIAHMLELCEAQMESALSESDIAVDALIKAFSGFAETARAVGTATEGLPAELRQGPVAGIDKQVTAMTQQVAAAIVAFQFYDKLNQRLGHVRYSLASLAGFVCDRAQARERDQWRQLFGTLKGLYRTEEERQIFQLMVEGASAQDVRDHIHRTTGKLRVNTTSDVELF